MNHPSQPDSTFPDTPATEVSSFAERFQHGRTKVGDIALHHVECGVGKPVLLIPGWPQSWYAWRRVMPALAATGRRVIAMNPRGLGDSDKPEQGYDLATVARDLHQLAYQLDLMSDGPLDVAGHDVGAWIGYAWAADWPEDIGHLALYDAALPGITPPTPAGVPTAEINARKPSNNSVRLRDSQRSV